MIFGQSLGWTLLRCIVLQLLTLDSCVANMSSTTSMMGGNISQAEQMPHGDNGLHLLQSAAQSCRQWGDCRYKGCLSCEGSAGEAGHGCYECGCAQCGCYNINAETGLGICMKKWVCENHEPLRNCALRPCPEGYFSVTGMGDGGISPSGCTACPAGTYNIGRIQRIRAHNGNFNDMNVGANSLQSCMPCNAGSYCPAGSNSVWGTVCPNGYLSSLLPPRDKIATSASITCTPCAPGTFTFENNSTFCKPCPPGTFTGTPATHTNCTPCAMGWTTIGEGSTICTIYSSCNHTTNTIYINKTVEIEKMIEVRISL